VTLVSLKNRRLGRSHTWFGGFEEQIFLLPLPGNEPYIVQPVAKVAG
jgi:hypothetical protein